LTLTRNSHFPLTFLLHPISEYFAVQDIFPAGRTFLKIYFCELIPRYNAIVQNFALRNSEQWRYN